MDAPLRDEVLRDRIRACEEFLDPTDQRARSYRADILLMLQQQRRRLVLSIDDIREHSRELANGLLNQPFDFSTAFDEALKRTVEGISNRPRSEKTDEQVWMRIALGGEAVDGANTKSKIYYCAYIGSFGEFACNPRTLSSQHLNHMVSLEGIVTKCSLVRPKIIKSVHYSEKKNEWKERRYQDQTMTATGVVSTSVYPQEDEEGNPVRHDIVCILRPFLLMIRS